MTGKFIFVLSALIAATPVWAADPANLETDKQRLSYTMGYQLGQNVRQQAVDTDTDAFIQAMRDAITGTPPRLSEEQMQAAVDAYQQSLQEKHMKIAQDNQAASKAFLEANKTKEGVMETQSGLQYKVIKAGTGKKPALDDTVVVNYRGTLIDGTEFDSSYGRGEPTEFQVQKVIKGWQEALQLMPEGSTWQVYIPSELAYGPRGAGGGLIGPNVTLIFDVELIKIK